MAEHDGVKIISPYEFDMMDGERKVRYLSELFEKGAIGCACKEASRAKFRGDINTPAFHTYVASIKAYSDIKQMVEKAKRDDNDVLREFALDIEDFMKKYTQAS